MENASKALIMAAGVLIGVLILSLAVFLFVDFGAKSREVNEQIEEKQLLQYNSQYTVYDGRVDMTIYDVVSLLNLAKENNKNYSDYTEYINGTDYKVEVKLPADMQGILTINLIDSYNEVNSSGEIKQKFKCTKISYYASGRVKEVIIAKVT